MSWRKKLRLPREHGAWGMLYTPFVLGALVAGQGGWRLLLLGLAMTFVFIGRESVLAWWRARTWGRDAGDAPRVAAIYLGLAAVSAAPLVLLDRLYGLIPLGGLTAVLLFWNSQQAARREERTIYTEVIGIAGLCLTAPAAHYVGVREWTWTAGWLWVLSVLYYASSVFYVKLRVLTAHAKRPEPVRQIRWQCGAYHGVLAVAIAGLVAAGGLGPYVLGAFAPIVLRAFWHLLRPAKELVLKRVGYLEIFYTLFFLVFTALAF